MSRVIRSEKLVGHSESAEENVLWPPELTSGHLS